MPRPGYFNTDAAYDLHSVLVDMLEEYEYEIKCHEGTGADVRPQRALIDRAKAAIAKAEGRDE